jgi:hypothetical protein
MDQISMKTPKTLNAAFSKKLTCKGTRHLAAGRSLSV